MTTLVRRWKTAHSNCARSARSRFARKLLRIAAFAENGLSQATLIRHVSFCRPESSLCVLFSCGVRRQIRIWKRFLEQFHRSDLSGFLIAHHARQSSSIELARGTKSSNPSRTIPRHTVRCRLLKRLYRGSHSTSGFETQHFGRAHPNRGFRLNTLALAVPMLIKTSSPERSPSKANRGY